jgi:hypothetical protein
VNATLRAVLSDLKSLDVVRVIEDVDEAAPDKPAEDEECARLTLLRAST